MAPIKNINDLKQWILTKQGDGVLCQEYTEAQLITCIEDAIEWYFQSGGLGSSYTNYIIYTVINNDPIVLPDFVKAITGILKPQSGRMDLSPQYTWGMFSSYEGNMKLADYVLYQQYTELVDFETTSPVRYQFGNDGKLYLNNTVKAGESIAIEYVGKVPTDFEGTYSHIWIKNYALELANIQWGINLSKYGNVVLQGGVTLNGERIYDLAVQARDKLEEEFYKKWHFSSIIHVG